MATPNLHNIVINDLTFDASFDSGNATRVEAVAECENEYALWTKRDCEGTAVALRSRIFADASGANSPRTCFGEVRPRTTGVAGGEAIRCASCLGDASCSATHGVKETICDGTV